jgi:prepilin-type processing-associated H-X9-DG protein
VVAPAGLRRYRRYHTVIGPPAWSSRAWLWEQAAEIADGANGDDAATGFIQRDHHAGNVLWVDGRVSGVVDFVEACAGPFAVDVAHVRINLVRHGGMETAERYARCDGITADPRWDLVDAIDMISDEVPAEWIEPFVASALSELG